MILNFKNLSKERREELKTITGTKVLSYILLNNQDLSIEDILTEAGKYSETPEELAYITYLIVGASISAGFIRKKTSIT